MEQALVHFSRLLRSAGVRVSTGEAVDGMRAAAAVAFADRETVKVALGLTLVKDSRDWPLYSELYDRFFRLEPPPNPGEAHEHSHAHDDLRDDLAVEQVTLSQEPAAAPQVGHDHGKPADIRDYFDERDLASSYNLHQEASKIDMASLTEHIVLAEDQSRRSSPDSQRVQLETDRLHGAESVGDLANSAGTRVDVDLSITSQSLALDSAGNADRDRAAEEALRRRVDGVLAALPELLRAHLARLAAQNRQLEHADAELAPAYLERVSERDRIRMEEGTRRLARQMHGALTSRTYPARRGRISVGQTMRRNLRHDGVPFRPVTVARREDRPRLVVLADVSLSVRNSARFTLHLVHGLQRMFPRVRTLAFVDDIVDVTEMFAEHPLEAALGLVFGGGVLDVDGNSNYGHAFGQFVETHLAAVTHRTSVVVLGDGRSNGADPGFDAFDSIARRARRVIWLTPEPRYSWVLGSCDLPGYAEMCQAVHVVRDVNGLDAATQEMTAALSRPT